MTHCKSQIGTGFSQRKQQGHPLFRKDEAAVRITGCEILSQDLFFSCLQETARAAAVCPESSPDHRVGDRLPGDRIGDLAAHSNRCVGHSRAAEGAASTENGGCDRKKRDL